MPQTLVANKKYQGKYVAFDPDKDKTVVAFGRNAGTRASTYDRIASFDLGFQPAKYLLTGNCCHDRNPPLIFQHC